MKITKVLVSVFVSIGLSVGLAGCVDVEGDDLVEGDENDDTEASAASSTQTPSSESAEILEPTNDSLARYVKVPSSTCPGPSYGGCTVGEKEGTKHYSAGTWYCCIESDEAY